MSINIYGKELREVRVIPSDTSPIFEVSNKEKSIKLNFEYKPDFNDEYDFNDYQLVILENNYLNAENDVFQVFNEDNKRLGWIFTLSNLESREHDYIGNKHLDKYKYVAFHLLLRMNDASLYRDNEIDLEKELLNLSDIYNDNIILFITFKENINTDNLLNYLPSLARYGYYKYSKKRNYRFKESQNGFLNDTREKDKLRLKLSNIDLNKDEFLYNLFTDYLKSLEHVLLRFHLLYQVFEHYMDLVFEKESDTVIQELEQKKISKNDFIERIGELRKERKLINKLLERDDFKGQVNNLVYECNEILNNNSKKTKSSLGDCIYDVRNLIVHNFRSISQKDFTVLDNIVEDLEGLVISILESNKLEL